MTGEGPWDAALAVPCPACGAGARVPCYRRVVGEMCEERLTAGSDIPVHHGDVTRGAPWPTVEDLREQALREVAKKSAEDEVAGRPRMTWKPPAASAWLTRDGKPAVTAPPAPERLLDTANMHPAQRALYERAERPRPILTGRRPSYLGGARAMDRYLERAAKYDNSPAARPPAAEIPKPGDIVQGRRVVSAARNRAGGVIVQYDDGVIDESARIPQQPPTAAEMEDAGAGLLAMVDEAIADPDFKNYPGRDRLLAAAEVVKERLAQLKGRSS